jgi:DNA-binding NarL/FixJ family response regulator
VNIGLASLDGLEAAARIHLVAPSARIIFLTQNSNKDVVQTAFRNGAQGYVLKTDAGLELLMGMQSVLRGRDFVSSGIRQMAPAARLKTRKRPLRFK